MSARADALTANGCFSNVLDLVGYRLGFLEVSTCREANAAPGPIGPAMSVEQRGLSALATVLFSRDVARTTSNARFKALQVICKPTSFEGLHQMSTYQCRLRQVSLQIPGTLTVNLTECSLALKLDDDLANGSPKTSLLHMMCSIGAQFYALEYSETVEQLLPKTILLAGSHWAAIARSLLLASFDRISVENLMVNSPAAVRLFSSNGNYTQAFMLSALMTRMTHALQINLEYTTDILGQHSDSNTLSVTARESRRRLMWSCYITDAHCGSGVDQLIPVDLMSQNSMNNISIAAYFIQHIETRKRVLKYIKH
ncbi:uncharacterized protein A1O9_02830 [Exophiala aquamarina CBS 119918]|uniref:Xylanolytic transcriptional activator regulatory domain-containing protein n=1 Tax=Exophiala aquamarina CBS 119918 TaxID=1182545 RepID=A0A072Q079_9EURO|nr:uncharacterized protein A1O9_02830 [Exophiala aquamarina CBS 119918]KEF61265.1 hypothetical protein A1O9_02830 [Exophiala aquamarina CBS 119918]